MGIIFERKRMIKNIAIVLADIRLACDRSALIFYPHAAGKFNFHLDAEDRKVELMIISLRIDHFINISCAANNHKFKTKMVVESFKKKRVGLQYLFV